MSESVFEKYTGKKFKPNEFVSDSDKVLISDYIMDYVELDDETKVALCDYIDNILGSEFMSKGAKESSKAEIVKWVEWITRELKAFNALVKTRENKQKEINDIKEFIAKQESIFGDPSKLTGANKSIYENKKSECERIEKEISDLDKKIDYYKSTKDYSLEYGLKGLISAGNRNLNSIVTNLSSDLTKIKEELDDYNQMIIGCKIELKRASNDEEKEFYSKKLQERQESYDNLLKRYKEIESRRDAVSGIWLEACGMNKTYTHNKANTNAGAKPTPPTSGSGNNTGGSNNTSSVDYEASLKTYDSVKNVLTDAEKKELEDLKTLCDSIPKDDDNKDKLKEAQKKFCDRLSEILKTREEKDELSNSKEKIYGDLSVIQKKIVDYLDNKRSAAKGDELKSVTETMQKLLTNYGVIVDLKDKLTDKDKKFINGLETKYFSSNDNINNFVVINNYLSELQTKVDKYPKKYARRQKVENIRKKPEWLVTWKPWARGYVIDAEGNRSTEEKRFALLRNTFNAGRRKFNELDNKLSILTEKKYPERSSSSDYSKKFNEAVNKSNSELGQYFKKIYSEGKLYLESNKIEKFSEWYEQFGNDVHYRMKMEQLNFVSKDELDNFWKKADEYYDSLKKEGRSR